jgi:adenylate cyclase
MDGKNKEHDAMVEEFWRSWFIEGPAEEKKRRMKFFQLLPAKHRCIFCAAPYDGIGGVLARTFFKVSPSRYNPLYCNTCDEFAEKYQGGAQVPVTMLFADIRGSTALAEEIGAKAFSALINRFYVKSTDVLSHAGAMIEKLVGDEITAVFSPGLSGEDYPHQAIEAARELLRVTGHGGLGQPWAPLGIGIHMGEAFLGSVGKPGGNMQVAALGEVPNTASRLTAMAGPGEILVSEETAVAAGLEVQGLERRQLELKGVSEPMDAFVLGL